MQVAAVTVLALEELNLGKNMSSDLGREREVRGTRANCGWRLSDENGTEIIVIEEGFSNRNEALASAILMHLLPPHLASRIFRDYALDEVPAFNGDSWTLLASQMPGLVQEYVKRGLLSESDV